MLCRKWFLVAAWLGASLEAWQAPVLGQQNPMNADQVIANYLLAIGGSDKIAAITTFTEQAELSGNLTSFGRSFGSPNMRNEHGTLEFYFKAPDLRFGVLKRENSVKTMYGCDGKVSWYIGPDAVPREFKPKAENEYECMEGYEPTPHELRAPHVRLQLKGQKKVGDRIAWEVRAQDPKSESTDNYYFDAETYLLLRWETIGGQALFGRGAAVKFERLYSDYRDVGGIKLAFMVVQKTDNSSLVTILREVKINAPIDDARFQEPKVLGGQKNPHVVLESPSKAPEVHAESPPSAPPSKTEAPAAVTPQEAQVAPEATYLVRTDFVSSSVAELHQSVPELSGLKAAEDQQALPALLDKIGQRTLELSRKIPDLISHEEVVESQGGAKTTREEFSYLILAHRGKEAVTLEEFRVDLKTGATLETDDAQKPGATIEPGAPSLRDDLASANRRINARAAGVPPLSQGFASMWVLFYPSNRTESNFRYLGEQKMDGHRAVVLAFAQKPGSVRLPGEVRLKDKSLPVYFQGIAWVDASDFRIVRLRTDLLSPVTDLPLTQLTSEVYFAGMQAAGSASPLWLPREVVVTSQVNGLTFHDKHSYSSYRSFKAHAKILLPP